MTKNRILVIDDDENHREGMISLLEEQDYVAVGAGSGKEAIQRLNETVFDLIITDYKMGEMDGMSLLRHLQTYFPSLKVIMVTGFGSIEHAVEAMKEGAINYITKPVKPQKLLEVIKEVLSRGTEETERSKISQNLQKYFHFHRFVGQSKAMQAVYRKINEVAGTDVPVLVIGESGTGKELVAAAIHDISRRKSGPFVAVNTGAIPRDLVASELFGHLKGAFTGAVGDKKGRFEEANNGTLFLDEIGTMSMTVQISLLRVLETHVIERVGSGRPINVDVRIIAASNEALENLIEKNQFREDLYYRLNVFSITIPPLRERKPDIIYLVNYYREMFNMELEKDVKNFTPEAIQALKAYDWPGNVRELRNVILRTILSSGAAQTIDLKNLPSVVLKPGLKGRQISFRPGTPLLEVEKTMILQTLKAVNGNKVKAANILGISRRSLYNKLEEYQIADDSL